MLLRAELLGAAAGPSSGAVSPGLSGGGLAGGGGGPLFGGEPPLRHSLSGNLLASSPSGGTPRSAGQARSPNLLRFMSGGEAGGSAGPPVVSPYAVSPVGEDGQLGATLASPRRAARKIPRTPFKVLDAPNLADDFYLNLVDWSGANTLAVGLGSCVYLWSACTSRCAFVLQLQLTALAEPAFFAQCGDSFGFCALFRLLLFSPFPLPH